MNDERRIQNGTPAQNLDLGQTSTSRNGEFIIHHFAFIISMAFPVARFLFPIHHSPFIIHRSSFIIFPTPYTPFPLPNLTLGDRLFDPFPDRRNHILDRQVVAILSGTFDDFDFTIFKRSPGDNPIGNAD